MQYFNPHLTIVMLIFAMETAITGTLFCKKLPKQSFFALRAGICLILAVGYAVFAPLKQMDQFIQLPLILLAFAHVGVCYKADFVVTVFYGEAIYLVQCIESALNTIIASINPEKLNHFGTEILTEPWGYALMILCYAVTVVMVYVPFIRRTEVVELQEIARLPVLGLGAIVLTTNQLWILNGPIRQNSSSLGNDLWCLVSCILCLCIQFGIFDSGRKDYELEIVRNLMLQKQEQYKTSRSMIQAINKKCHQLKLRLSEMAAAGEEQKHIDEAMELVNSLDAKIHTGNEVLDIIFTEKNFYCLQSQITFVCMIDGEKLNFMNPIDLYVLFGNLIDDAIQAVRKLTDVSRRTIYINVRADKQLLLVQTENPCDEAPKVEDGWPVAFGMRSVRMIVEKYSGSGNVRYTDGTFYLNIVIPIKGEEGRQ